VIIPAYNRAAEIGVAIASVLEQSFTDFELIVVDDLSTDGTVAAVEAIADPRLRLVRRQYNGGPGAARNSGVLASRGEIIAFLDSDDLWLPEKLARQVAFMSERGVPICCTGFRHLRPRGGGPEIRLPDPPHLTGDDMIDHADVTIGTTMAIERELFDLVGPFDENMRRLEDWDWQLRLGRIGGLDFVPAALAIHYAPDARDIADATDAAAGLILSKHGAALAAVDARLDRRLRAMAARHQASANWISGRYLGALGHALQSLSLQPAAALEFAARRLSG
jgi:glycosyltransferase involved in cell wall biosynthesis